MVRSRSFALALALALLASTHCAQILGLEDHEPYPPGSSVAFDPPVVLASGQRGPLGIATDANRVYFAAEIGKTLNAVEKRPSAPVIVLAQGLPSPRHVALDDVRVYVGTAAGCTDATPGVASFLKDGTSRVNGKQLNCADDMSSMTLAGGTVYGVRKGSTVLMLPSTLSSVKAIAEKLDGITGIAARDGEVYFTSSTKGAVNAVRPPAPAVVAFAVNQPSPQDVTVDEAFVYWLDGDGTVMKLARATPSQPPTVMATGQPSPRRITQFADNVYFTCGDGTVRLVPKAGGEVRTVASNQAGPTGIAVDAAGVYWTNRANDTVMMAVRR